MKRGMEIFETVDQHITRWMARNGIVLLRISVGIVFFWFGVLKLFPGMSPAQNLAIQTIQVMTFGLVPDQVALFTLAAWETLIGVGLILGIFMRQTLLLLFLQMLGTLTPLAFFPHETFVVFPIAPSLEGQYIIKNLVLISAGIVMGATVRGGRIVSDPRMLKTTKSLLAE